MSDEAYDPESEVERERIAELNRVLHGHFQLLDESRELLSFIRSAADHQLWEKANRWSKQLAIRDDAGNLPFPIKMQVNTIRPWLARNVSALYVRAPNPTVKAPIVQSSSARGRLRQEDADILSAIGKDWLAQEDVQDQVEQVLELALLQPRAALKIGYDSEIKGSHVERVWLSVLPMHEVIVDERSTRGTQRYIGHLRWETIETATKLLGVNLKAEKVQTHALSDYIADGVTYGVSDVERGKGYVQVLDWYDLVLETFEQFLVEVSPRPSVRLFPEHKVRKPPYRKPNGKPLIPIEPVILANSVGFPMSGIAQAKPLYEETCEKSMLLTIVVNAFRRDAARVILFLEDVLPTEKVKMIANALDTQFVGISKGEQAKIADILHAFVMPNLAETLDKAQKWLALSAQEQSSLSSLGRGQTQDMKYATSTTTQIVAQGDAAVSSAPAARMNLVLSRIVQSMFSIIGQEGGGLKVTRGGVSSTVKAEKLKAAWRVGIEDGSSQAAKQQARSAELVQGVPVWVGMIAVAAGVQQEGMPAIPDAIRVANQLAADLMADALALPDNMRWDVIRAKKPDIQPEAPSDTSDAAEFAAPAPGAAPVEEAAPAAPEGPGAEEALIAELRARLKPEELQALAAEFAGEAG